MNPKSKVPFLYRRIFLFLFPIIAFFIGFFIPNPWRFSVKNAQMIKVDEETEEVVSLRISNNQTYTGSVLKQTQQMHGFGILTKTNSIGEFETYEGNWNYGGLRFGRHTTPGKIYEGTFDEALRYDGFGILNYLRGPHAGSTFIGNWDKDNKEGIGRWMKDGEIEFGNYKNGVCQPVKGANYRVGDSVYGVDFSHWQEDINWDNLVLYCDKNGTVFSNKAKNKTFMQPVFFAYLKATEGATVQDAKYDIRMKEASRHGIVRGSYHFLRSGSAESQIQNFLNNSHWSKGDLPPALDVEIELDSPEALRLLSLKWLKSVEKALGVRPIIYTTERIRNKYFNDSRFSGYDFWIARYSIKGPDNDGWVMWQKTQNGEVKGHNGPVDIDCYKGNYSAFQKYINSPI